MSGLWDLVRFVTRTIRAYKRERDAPCWWTVIEDDAIRGVMFCQADAAEELWAKTGVPKAGLQYRGAKKTEWREFVSQGPNHLHCEHGDVYWTKTNPYDLWHVDVEYGKLRFTIMALAIEEELMDMLEDADIPTGGKIIWRKATELEIKAHFLSHERTLTRGVDGEVFWLSRKHNGKFYMEGRER